jgi:hypothetical protein
MTCQVTSTYLTEADSIVGHGTHNPFETHGKHATKKLHYPDGDGRVPADVLGEASNPTGSE